MFAWCVGALRFAEAVAYKRIAAARAARRHPELLEAVRRIPVPDARPPALPQGSLRPKATAAAPQCGTPVPPAETPHLATRTRPLGGERHMARFRKQNEVVRGTATRHTGIRGSNFEAQLNLNPVARKKPARDDGSRRQQ
jgi:hypothetical protein